MMTDMTKRPGWLGWTAAILLLVIVGAGVWLLGPTASQQGPGAEGVPPSPSIEYRMAQVKTATPRPTATSAAAAITRTPVRPSATPAQPVAADPGQVKHITVDDARNLVDMGSALFVDVRSEAAYNEAHLPGAILMQDGVSTTGYRELPDDRLLIFYCACGDESASDRAALNVRQHGFDRVASLAGGWAAWQRAGYAVERQRSGATTPVAAGGQASTLGKPDAPVVIVEFTDFQCGYCADYALNTLPKIKDKFIDSGQVYYVLRDFPLEFHTHARPAALAARCAGAQGQYWAMHDLLYGRHAEWSGVELDQAREIFEKFAETLDLDGRTWELCMDSGAFEDAIEQDILAGQQSGVSGTPSFLINGELVVGAYPFETFETKIETALKNGQ